MIKKFLLLSTIILTLLFSGCNKDNENLIRGKWQLRHIDMPNNSQISTDSVFYSFQLNIFELATLVQGNDFSAEKTNGIYTIKTDSIFMTVTPVMTPSTHFVNSDLYAKKNNYTIPPCFLRLYIQHYSCTIHPPIQCRDKYNYRKWRIYSFLFNE